MGKRTRTANDELMDLTDRLREDRERRRVARERSLDADRQGPQANLTRALHHLMNTEIGTDVLPHRRYPELICPACHLVEPCDCAPVVTR